MKCLYCEREVRQVGFQTCSIERFDVCLYVDDAGPGPDETLAKFLACAYIAYNLGVSLGHCWKHYIRKDEPSGTYWLNLSRQVFRDHMKMHAAEEDNPNGPKSVS